MRRWPIALGVALLLHLPLLSWILSRPAERKPSAPPLEIALLQRGDEGASSLFFELSPPPLPPVPLHRQFPFPSVVELIDHAFPHPSPPPPPPLALKIPEWQVEIFGALADWRLSLPEEFQAQLFREVEATFPLKLHFSRYEIRVECRSGLPILYRKIDGEEHPLAQRALECLRFERPDGGEPFAPLTQVMGIVEFTWIEGEYAS